MKISVSRPKCAIGNFVYGEVFLFEGEYYIKTTHIDENDYCYCVALSDGSTTYFDPYQQAEIVNGEFVIKEK